MFAGEAEAERWLSTTNVTPKIAETAAAARTFSKRELDFASVDFSLQSYTSVSIDRNTR
jgi:hypothetical protein